MSNDEEPSNNLVAGINFDRPMIPSLGGLGGQTNGPPALGFGLNLGALGNKADYNDEFMGKIDEFSESWRQ